MAKENKKTKAKKLNLLGNLLIFLGLLFIVFTFGPAVREEAKYQTRGFLGKEIPELTPPNEDFAIVVRKIGAAAPVFANVNPFEENEYLPVLRRGVAHAEGTSFPGQDGNTYLFAHSTDAFYNVGRYNAVFYLLNKLEVDDEVEVYYKGEKFVYKVRSKRVVSPEAVEYLGDLGGNTLTLQTCYPPGTTLNRLVVVADQVESDEY